MMLPSMERPPSLRVMISASAGTGGSVGIVVGLSAWLRQRWVLGCNGTRGWNLGEGMDLGVSLGLGINNYSRCEQSYWRSELLDSSLQSNSINGASQ